MTLSDMIVIMSDFDPLRERFLIWNFTRSDILHRVEVWAQYNIVTRIGTMFGGSTDDGKKVPVRTDDDAIAKLQSFVKKGK
jgi:hypothetical protein